MSTIKISALPILTQLNANTSNTLFVGVDVPSDVTGKMTVTTLAAGLYSNNPLAVGNNNIVFSNTVAQFSGYDPTFLQTNFQNFNPTGSIDLILTADNGTNQTNYLDLGLNNSQFNNAGYTAMFPLDGYLYVQDASGNNSGGNLVIGTAKTNTQINIIVAGTNANNVVANITNKAINSNVDINVTGNVFATGSFKFHDGSTQTSAAAPAAYAQSAYSTANSATSNTVYTQGVDAAQNTLIQNAYTLANTSLQNTTGVFGGTLTFTGDVTANNLYTPNQLEFTTGSGLIRTYNRSGGSKDINVIAGNDLISSNGGSINITSGNSGAGGGNGGNIVLTPGTGNVSSGNVVVSGNIIVSGNTTLNGNTYFNSNTIHYGNLVTHGNLITVGTMTTTGDVITTGNLIATGNTVFNGQFINNGTTYNNGLTVLNGILSVNNSIVPANSNVSLGTANNPFNSIYVSNNRVILSNSSLVLTGTLGVAGNSSLTGTLTANGQSDFNGLVIIQNQNYSQNTGALEIIGSTNGSMVSPAANGTMIHVTGLDTVSTKVMVDNFGPGNTYSLFVGRAGRGTAGSPTSTQSGDVIARYSGSSYGTTGFSAVGSGRMDITAIENHSDTNKGTMISFGVAAVGSNTITSNVLTIASNVVNITSNTTLKVSNTIQYDSSVNNGTVTQLTSKSTAVTLNGRTGQITTNNATLNKGVAVQFTVNNNFIVSAKDVVIVNIASGTSVGYDISVNSVTPGSFVVNLHNSDSTPSGSNASDTLVINFAIIRVA
jgi:hypothetical protein